MFDVFLIDDYQAICPIIHASNWEIEAKEPRSLPIILLDDICRDIVVWKPSAGVSQGLSSEQAGACSDNIPNFTPRIQHPQIGSQQKLM